MRHTQRDRKTEIQKKRNRQTETEREIGEWRGFFTRT